MWAVQSQRNFAITALAAAAALAGCGSDRAADPASGQARAAVSADDPCAGPPSTVLSPVPTSGGGSGAIDIKIHYHRGDGAFTGWGLHVWQIGDAGQYLADYPGVSWPAPLAPASFDDYGAVFQIEAAKLTAAQVAGLGFIVHRGDDKDPDGDRLWRFTDGGELWLLSGDATIYRQNPLAGALDLSTVRVHYQRLDGHYGVWGLHLWGGSGVDVGRLPGLTTGDWGNPVPLTQMPGFTAAPDGSEVAFDLPVENPKDHPGRSQAEFVLHGTPANPDGGVNNKDGWNDNQRISFAGLSVVGGVGHVWLVQQDPHVYTAPPRLRLTSTTDARAYWLTRGLVRWPGEDAAGVFKLYHSATGQLVARAGAPVTGADGALALTVSTQPLPPAKLIAVARNSSSKRPMVP